jgi:hypothetical protein
MPVTAMSEGSDKPHPEPAKPETVPILRMCKNCGETAKEAKRCWRCGDVVFESISKGIRTVE